MSIRVESVHKSFGAFKALDDVTLEFPSGELVALLGPSGCGKTTLLRSIAGLEAIERGRILLDGEDVTRQDARNRRVGFVFQHYALFRHMSVFENVAFGMRMKPKKERPDEARIRRRVHDLLELVQLDWLAERLPAELSGGQRQRIALARALAVEPRVLLLDEPFGALDAKVRRELRGWLRRLHDELHVTSVFVTHDQDEALEVADRVVLLNRGRIEQIGTPDEVYQTPATAFVYGFLGAVNLFHGRVDADRKGIRVGSRVLPASSSAHDPGDEVLGFARPHELDILPDDGLAVGVTARVDRVLSFGPIARVELSGAGEAQGQRFEVAVPAERLDPATVTAGRAVRLVPSRMRVFASTERRAVADLIAEAT
jgi:sulfate/thiosulfate transport system ATP-binding protein